MTNVNGLIKDMYNVAKTQYEYAETKEEEYFFKGETEILAKLYAAYNNINLSKALKDLDAE